MSDANNALLHRRWFHSKRAATPDCEFSARFLATFALSSSLAPERLGVQCFRSRASWICTTNGTRPSAPLPSPLWGVISIQLLMMTMADWQQRTDFFTFTDTPDSKLRRLQLKTVRGGTTTVSQYQS